MFRRFLIITRCPGRSRVGEFAHGSTLGIVIDGSWGDMSSLLYCSCLSFSRALGGAVGGRGVGITSIGGRFDTQLSSKDEWSALGRVVLATGGTRAIFIDLSSRGKSLPIDDPLFRSILGTRESCWCTWSGYYGNWGIF